MAGSLIRRCPICGEHELYGAGVCGRCGQNGDELNGRGEGEYVLRLLGIASIAPPTGYEGWWLVDYDPKRPGATRDGRRPMICYIEATDDPADALRFADPVAVRREWMRWDGAIRPHDGLPSRPLSAFSIETMKLDEAQRQKERDARR